MEELVCTRTQLRKTNTILNILSQGTGWGICEEFDDKKCSSTDAENKI